MQTVSATTKQVNGEKAVVNGKTAKEKMELPVEMAGMVPLRLLIGKMVSKAYSDLMTLTDTLPAMSDIERKRQILYFTTETRKQFLKLMVLVHWAKDANDIQMCQNIMAFLANQNRMFQESVDYLHKIHAELPAARVRNFDILTAVDVLTTGSYQRMPTKVQDMLPPAPLTDDQVLQTFDKMNDELRIRMLTKEVLPVPMNNYRIANGRIYFCVNNEFEVAMTLMGNVNQQKWWIVSLDILVQPSATGSAADVDITLNETQRQRLRSNAQAQLTPPENDPHFFPLVNLYDYLHLFCLNMQLEILFMQATMMAKTRWMDQLKVQMNVARTTLTLSYWGGGSPTAHWGSPQNKEDATIAPVAAPGAMLPPSTVVEIAIQDQATPQMAVAIRDEWKGLIQKSGLGASVALSDLDDQAKSKVFAALKYPKTLLSILWNADKDLHSDEPLLDPSQLNVERLLLHMTAYHRQSILDKFHTLLQSQAAFLEENGLLFIDKSASSTASAHGRPLMVQFRPDRFVHLDVDSRTGRVKVSETGKHGSDGDVKLRGLEERLNTDPTNLARHLIWLRSEVVVHEIVSLAKQLHWTPFHPTQMLLQPDDMVKLFDDPEPPSATASAAGAAHPTAPSSTAPVATTTTTTPGKPGYPAHCVFLQFAQFEDWYLVIAVMHNEFQASLCCLRKSDQNVQHQEFVDLIHVDYQQIWKERFGSGRLDDMLLPVKPESHDDAKQLRSAKRRRTLQDTAPLLKDNTKVQSSASSSKTDNLSIDLSFLAKLESLSRAFITNRKIELQLQQYRTIPSYTRPFLSALWGKQRRAIHHPSADRMEVVCVHQRDLLRTCATRNVDVVMSFAPGANAPVNTSLRAEMLPWVEPILPKMTNEVVMRTSGWWERGAAECYVEIQDRVNWNNIPLRTNELSDHIVLDRETNVLTFTYTDVDTCIGRFLTDWERVFMMANLSRQVSSVWFRKYADQLKFEPCDMQTLSFTYAKQLHCSIRWEAPAKGKARRYFVQLACDAVPGLKRNPHHRVQHFLQDVLNDKKDLVFFVQVLFQTLPLMTTLEHMEAAFARSNTITRLTIIPRAPDAVRILFSTSHGIDIRFDGPDTICISDAAFHHTLYPSVAKATGQPPAPFIPAATAGHAPAASASNAPIQLTQPVQCVEFAVFAQLLVNVDDWIFHPHAENDNDLMITDDDDENDESPWFMQGKAWHTAALEPFVLPFDHGLLCSASLCRNVLLKLQKSAASASPAIDAAAIAL